MDAEEIRLDGSHFVVYKTQAQAHDVIIMMLVDTDKGNLKSPEGVGHQMSLSAGTHIARADEGQGQPSSSIMVKLMIGRQT